MSTAAAVPLNLKIYPGVFVLANAVFFTIVAVKKCRCIGNGCEPPKHMCNVYVILTVR
jgi:hypothetical protein